MLNTYIKHELSKLGYPSDLEVHYTLDYKQTSGVAFFGRIPMFDLENIFKRMNTEADVLSMFTLMGESGCYDVVIQRNGSDCYNHYRSMRIETSVDFTLMDQQWANSLLDKKNVDLTLFQRVWLKFIHDLSTEIVALSQRFEREGYYLKQGTTWGAEEVWVFSTAKYLFRLVEVPASDLNIGYWETESKLEVINGILNGQLLYLDLELSVVDRASGQELVKVKQDSIVVGHSRQNYHGERQEMVREAIAVLREQQLKQQVARFDAKTSNKLLLTEIDWFLKEINEHAAHCRQEQTKHCGQMREHFDSYATALTLAEQKLKGVLNSIGYLRTPRTIEHSA